MKSKSTLYLGAGSLVLAFAALVNPDKPLSSSLPVVLGDHADLFALTFFVIGFSLIYNYYRSGKS